MKLLLALHLWCVDNNLVMAKNQNQQIRDVLKGLNKGSDANRQIWAMASIHELGRDADVLYCD